MKHVKKILSLVLAVALIVTACLTDGFGVFAVNADGSTDTEVQEVWSDFWNQGALTFMLSEGDYVECGGTQLLGERHKEYNYLDNITVYFSDETSKQLGETCNYPSQYCNMWGWGSTYGNMLTIGLKQTDAVKVFIPKGTYFPAVSYTGTCNYNAYDPAKIGTSNQKGGYVTTSDIYFEKPENTITINNKTFYNWEKHVLIDTDVQYIQVRNNNMLILRLTEYDYPAESGSYIGIGDKISEYNLLSKIRIYKGEESKLLSELGISDKFYSLWGETGAVAVRIGTEGWTSDTITKVEVESGCEFPSYEYTNNGSTVKNGYITKEKVVFTPNSQEAGDKTDWTKKYVAESSATAVTGVVTGRNGNNITFTLSENDFGGEEHANYVLGDSHKDYNYLDKIQIYVDGNAEPVSLRTAFPDGGQCWINTWVILNTLSVPIGDYVSTATKVVIPQGTVFPAVAYTRAKFYDASKAATYPDVAATQKGLGGYETTTDITYVATTTTDAGGAKVWQVYEGPAATSVTKLMSGINGDLNGLTFTLSDCDYAGVESNTGIGEKHTQYNYLEQILLYTNDVDCVTLGSAYNNEQRLYNMLGNENTVTIQISNDVSTIKKVVIPAGTVFPSYAYTNQDAADKGGYATTKDITFYMPYGASGKTTWQTTEPLMPTETDVTSFVTGVNNNGFAMFYLSSNDYTTKYNVGKADGGNYMSQIQVYTDDTTSQTLGSIFEGAVDTNGKKVDEIHYNMWDKPNSLAVEWGVVASNSAVKVVIPKGTVFPAYEYTDGGRTEKGGYITTEEIVFVRPEGTFDNKDYDKGVTWKRYYEINKKETRVSKLQLRDSRLLFFLSQNDYQDVAASTQINASKLEAYNTLDSILLCLNGDMVTLRKYMSDGFYNLYGESGVAAFEVGGFQKYNKSNITKVLVKAGCEFPSYQFTENGAEKPTAYVVQEDTLFDLSENEEATFSHVGTKVHTIETTMEEVKAQNYGLTFRLKDNDYPTAEDGKANLVAKDKYKDYNFLANIKIYTKTEDGEDAQSLANLQVASNADFNNVVYYNMWAGYGTVTVGCSTLFSGQNNLNDNVVRIVIPAGTVFPSYDYTGATSSDSTEYKSTQLEKSGYEIKYEMIFEKNAEGDWVDVSYPASGVSADANGSGKVDSLDIVRAKWYIKNGYGHNLASDCNDDNVTDEADVKLIREVILGKVLHNYKKESTSLTYFSSSDIKLDSFLNDFYKRQIGYNDYVEGDMTVTSYKPGTTYSSIYNLPWLTKSLLWVDSKNSLESDRTAQLKKQIESVIVDRYGYVWNGDDAVEDPMLGIGMKHGMGWPFPNATHAGNSGSTGDTTNVRSWEFNTKDTLSIWTSSLSDAPVGEGEGLYQGTENSTTSVTFTVEDYGYSKSPIIRETASAPWLSFELRMSNVTNPENIDDIYVKWVDSDSNEYEVKAGDIAALNYEFGTEYNHVLYLPMYTHPGWNGKQIKKITIEIRGTAAFGGTFALNYVRPSYDTRHSNNNANYIEALKEYYNMTGDVNFVKANITKARKAMNFYLQMYDTTLQLNDQSYLYGHGGSRTALKTGLGNGYWDILYTPRYDFQSNMYFYQALKDLSYLEDVLSKNSISVSDSATIDTATTDGKASSEYKEDARTLGIIANNVLDTMRDYFWNAETGRFMAGYNGEEKVDYGYTTWNLEAIERGIATPTQKTSIMSWIDGTRPVSGSNEQTDIYGYSFAPRTATVDDKGTSTNASGIYGAFIVNGGNDFVKQQKFGKSLQFGGAVMYSSYYDLTSRIQVNDADDALTRLKGIQTWYEEVSAAYKSSNDPEKSVKNFYLPYFEGKDVTMQNGARGTGNGAVGIDGEFTESLLVAAAIPYGFFGMDSEGGNTLCVTPNLPSTMDRWKVENMQYNGVTYDLSIYKDAVRIDSVRGDATGLKVKVTLDCPEGKDIYVDGAKKAATKADGKATVTVDFADATIEVKEEEK